MPTSASLTIVQLTDCHLLADRAGTWNGVPTWQRFDRVLADLDRRAQAFDLLVITGDTAEDEALATYEAVRDALGDHVSRLRLVPGNHDDRRLLQRVFPEACNGTDGQATFHLLEAGWQVIGLDSQRTGEDSGELGAAQLAWLRSLLEAEPAVDTLLFVHHPPIEVGSRWLDEIGLRDSDALAEVLAAHPQVRLVVSGHVHHEVSGSLAHARVHTTPAVASQIEPQSAAFALAPGPPAYRILELHPGGGSSTRVVQVDET